MRANVIEIPDEYMPVIEELPGDLSEVAKVIEEKVPGKGVAVTLAIANHFHGTYIYCHNVTALLRGARDRNIRSWRDQGHTVPEIARRVGLGERRVWDILNVCDND